MLHETPLPCLCDQLLDLLERALQTSMQEKHRFTCVPLDSLFRAHGLVQIVVQVDAERPALGPRDVLEFVEYFFQCQDVFQDQLHLDAQQVARLGPEAQDQLDVLLRVLVRS